MKRAIVGYHRDDEADWVAELDCHHGQHVRHRPPFTNRPWVETRAGRDAHLGALLDCVLCDALEMPAHLVPYKRTPEFTEDTVPAGLLGEHATKKGVWGQIAVQEGALEYLVERPEPRTLRVTPRERANIAPEMPHAVRPVGPVRFYVEFFRPESPGVRAKRALLTTIADAFPESPTPARLAGRPGCGADEYAYVDSFFSGRKWTEISLESLRHGYEGPPDACLSFMSHEAFRYFLPAFMRLFVERWEDADVIADAAIFSLVPTTDPKLERWQAERFAGFDERQRRAIAAFLDYAAEYHETEYDTFRLPDARRYWRNPT